MISAPDFSGASTITVPRARAEIIRLRAGKFCLRGPVPGGYSERSAPPVSRMRRARSRFETGGVILSEYPPGTGPRKQNFPARNRIISALARGTVIVEAPEKSGALITAAFALEQGRDLWVDRAGLASAGAGRLAEDGAVVIDSAKDILTEWNLEVPNRGNKAAQPAARNNAEGAALAASLAKYLDIRL